MFKKIIPLMLLVMAAACAPTQGSCPCSASCACCEQCACAKGECACAEGLCAHGAKPESAAQSEKTPCKMCLEGNKN